MAQLLTTLKSSHGIHPSIPSPLVRSVQKLGSNCVDYGKLSSFSETRSSSHKILSASTRLRLKGPRRIRCSANNTAAGQQGNVIGADDGEALEKYIEDAGDKLVVVAVSTTTCGPCKLIFPKVVKMSTEYPDVLFYKIDGDKSSSTRALMRKWGVRAVPNFRFFRNGKLVHQHSGAKEAELRAYFLSHYASIQSVT